MNFVCGFHNMEPLDNEGKRLVSVMWRWANQTKPDLGFDMDAKLHVFVL